MVRVIGAGSSIGATLVLTSSAPANPLVVLEATNVSVIPEHSRESDAPDYRI